MTDNDWQLPSTNKLMSHWAKSFVTKYERPGQTLDYSLESIKVVEQHLAQLHRERTRRPRFLFHLLRLISRAPHLKLVSLHYGSYVGECIRRTCGGTWIMGGEMYPGMSIPVLQLPNGRSECWPQIKVEKRILNGEEDNIWHYAQLIVRQAGGPSPGLQEWHSAQTEALPASSGANSEPL